MIVAKAHVGGIEVFNVSARACQYGSTVRFVARYANAVIYQLEDITKLALM